jgi:hypothetical protein
MEATGEWGGWVWGGWWWAWAIILFIFFLIIFAGAGSYRRGDRTTREIDSGGTQGKRLLWRDWLSFRLVLAGHSLFDLDCFLWRRPLVVGRGLIRSVCRDQSLSANRVTFARAKLASSEQMQVLSGSRSKRRMAGDALVGIGEHWWTHQDLNLGPLACEFGTAWIQGYLPISIDMRKARV